MRTKEYGEAAAGLLTFIPDLGDFGSLDVMLKAKFKDNIHPLITIASNNGFEYYRGRSGVNKILFFQALLLIFKTIIMGQNICALIGKAPINEVKVKCVRLSRCL
jgi:hypothetical protein